MLKCAIHPITYRGEEILATVVKKKSLNTCRYGKWDYNESICTTKKEEKLNEKTF